MFFLRSPKPMFKRLLEWISEEWRYRKAIKGVKEEKHKEFDSKFEGGICVHMRGDVHMLLKNDAVLPPETIQDMNAYQAECHLLDILRNAGYTAGYEFDENQHPQALLISIPAGEDGYPQYDEHLYVFPTQDINGKPIIGVEQDLTKPSMQSSKVVVFPKHNFKIGFLNRLAARYDLWKYRRTVLYLKDILPGIHRHLPTR
jgi:hypothetical protein